MSITCVGAGKHLKLVGLEVPRMSTEHDCSVSQDSNSQLLHTEGHDLVELPAKMASHYDLIKVASKCRFQPTLDNIESGMYSMQFILKSLGGGNSLRQLLKISYCEQKKAEFLYLWHKSNSAIRENEKFTTKQSLPLYHSRVIIE